MQIQYKLIFAILIFGIIFKLLLTSGGNFLFNMDNARDLVDVREMVVLQKPRLIGPTSAVEGLFNGPFWYYLLAIPFILSGGDPYSTIILQIVLWAAGGFFLLKIVSLWGKFLIFPVGLLWIASDYINLTTSYAFNPNPVTLLTPLFIYLLYKFIESKKYKYCVLAFLLGGAFFNFEMNFGIFMPVIIFVSVFILDKKLLKSIMFWLSSVFFILCLMPQILFDIKHNFLMSNSVLNYLRNQDSKGYNLVGRFKTLFESFMGVFSATYTNKRSFVGIILIFLCPFILKLFKDKIATISFIYIVLPFIIYLFVPVSVNPWHIGAEAVALIILSSYLIKVLWTTNFAGKAVGFLIAFFMIFFSITNIFNFFFVDRSKPNMDPSAFINEIRAIDYVYNYAGGKNFKAYAYLPSVYDYPYQYLFWWYGNKKYGYIPGEYEYSPNKPELVRNKEKFVGLKNNFSGLVFLIMEPDRIGYREAWIGDFNNLEFISREWVGPLEIIIKREL